MVSPLSSFCGTFITPADFYRQPAGSAYAVLFEPQERWVIELEAGDRLSVEGCQTQVFCVRAGLNLDLANRPSFLLVRRLSSKNKRSKKLFCLALAPRLLEAKYSVASPLIVADFVARYPSLQSYSIYRRHQFELAIAARNYKGSSSLVADWMRDNEFYANSLSCSDASWQLSAIEELCHDAKRAFTKAGLSEFVNQKLGHGRADFTVQHLAFNEIAMAYLDYRREYFARSLEVDVKLFDESLFLKARDRLNELVSQHAEMLPVGAYGALDFEKVLNDA